MLFAGYLFTYFNTRINEERKAQIERVNEQVRSYGLYSTSSSLSQLPLLWTSRRLAEQRKSPDLSLSPAAIGQRVVWTSTSVRDSLKVGLRCYGPTARRNTNPCGIHIYSKRAPREQRGSYVQV